jgi:hypothetical protein
MDRINMLLVNLVFILLLFVSCKKDLNLNPILENNINSKNNAFLKRLNFIMLNEKDENYKSNLENLKNLVTSGDVFSSQLNDSITIEIISIASLPKYFSTSSTDGKWFVLYRYNALKKINNIEILNFKNDTTSLSTKDVAASILKLYSFDIPKSGVYSRYSIGGRFLNREEYFQDKLTKYAIVIPERPHNGNNQDIKQFSVLSSCIDWYLVTTITYGDGSVYQYKEYLGTTCSSNCSPSPDYQSIACDPSDEFGGEPPSQNSVYADPSWVVASNGLSGWIVKSYEHFEGIKGDINKFTAAQHKNSDVFSPLHCIANGQGPYVTWNELNASTNIIYDQFAKTTIFSKLSFCQGQSQEVSNVKGFYFNSLWP